MIRKHIPWIITLMALAALVGPALSSQTGVANSAADLSGKILMVANSTTPRTVTNAFTYTGLQTFNRGAAAPFAVDAASTKVTNLDADKLDGIDSTAFATSANITTAVNTNILAKYECGLRLSLTTGVPITTSDVTAATTVYVTPIRGGICSFYDGSSTWTTLANAEVSIALGTDTASLPYDVFCYNNAGTMACERLAWTNDTTRATALVLQNNIWSKTGALTRRYIGTYRTTTVAGQTEDSYAKRYVYNYYYQVERALKVLEATDSWSYATATTRQANGSTANQIEVMVGLSENSISVTVHAEVSTTTPGNDLYTTIGEGSTTTPSSNAIQGRHDAPTTGVMSNEAFLNIIPAVGLRQFIWQEKGAGAGTITWYGDNGGPPATQSGIIGRMRM